MGNTPAPELVADPLPKDYLKTQLLPLLGNNAKAVDDLVGKDRTFKYSNTSVKNITITFPSFFYWYEYIDTLPITTPVPELLKAYRNKSTEIFNLVSGQLNKIHASFTGKALFRELGQTDAKHLTISTTPVEGGPVTVADDPDADGATDTTIKIGEALADQKGFAVRNDIIAAGDLLDELLFHEMVHATGMLRGKGQTHQRPTWVEKKYSKDSSDIYEFDTERELLAIAITNMYISEKGKGRPLRGNHRPGDTTLKNPGTFLHNYPGLHPSPYFILQNFSLDQPEFYRALLRVPSPPAWFNPAKQYEAWK